MLESLAALPLFLGEAGGGLVFAFQKSTLPGKTILFLLFVASNGSRVVRYAHVQVLLLTSGEFDRESTRGIGFRQVARPPTIAKPLARRTIESLVKKILPEMGPLDAEIVENSISLAAKYDKRIKTSVTALRNRCRLRPRVRQV